MFTPLARLREHTAERPDEPALIAIDRTWSFAELDAVTGAVAARLRALGLGPRQLVAVDLPAADDWIITISLLRMGASSVSVSGVDRTSGLVADALITRPGAAAVTAATVVQVDRLWIEQAEIDAGEGAASGPIVLYPRPDSVCRVILTSGTTGAPRAVELSVSAIEHRLAHLAQYWTDDRRELTVMGLSTTGGLHSALGSLVAGTPYLAIDAINARGIALAAEHEIEVLCGSPVQVGRVLAVMRDRELPLPALREVRLAGDAPTARLLAAIDEQLAVPVRGVYGSTEGGGVTSRMIRAGDDLADAGGVVPGVELQIVGDDDLPLPADSIGSVRYRGAGLANGYLGADDDSAFRRGWFFPGDMGRLTADGALVLAGRQSEVVNLGGVKLDPARIDALAETHPGVLEAGSFGIERIAGVTELGLAVVADDSCDLQALDAMLRQLLVGKHPTVFGRVAAIPRNRMGKIERARLTAEFRRRLNLD